MQPNGQRNYWQPQADNTEGDLQPQRPVASRPVPPRTEPMPAAPPPEPQAPLVSPTPPLVTPAAPVNAEQPPLQSVPEATAPTLELELDDIVDDVADPLFDEPASETNLSWEAADFIHHEKDAAWFGIFALVVIAMVLFVLFVLKDYVLLALVVAMAIALFAFARRPARVVRYTLTPQGIHIGQVFHALSEFRAFGVVRDGDFYAIMLMPVKRIALATFVYFPEEKGEQIVDMLGAYLPMEPVKLDIVDIAIRKIRL
ncbi:MAG TPA: hypothetical protein VD907_05740 [Verrucomicrobiae bacterium]|nr:hypothetical protein [Verrucomicrobiae bacterium]